jgi:lincosamide nucleotidyltransferase A/C/D/E
MADTDSQVAVIKEIGDVLATAGVRWWLFGGWGIDAHIGRITREHGDIELWVRNDAADAVRTALVVHGFEAIATQPPEEAQEFERDGVRFSAAFFVRTDDGYARPEGRWSDWSFPPGSFGDLVGTIRELRVPVMSIAGMLAMKTQYATLRNGHPLRPKDIADMVVLRGLLSR